MSTLNYHLLQQTLELLEQFSNQIDANNYNQDINGFKQWIVESENSTISKQAEPHWEGKENGRSAESAISTLFVQMNRYAKNYSRSAIYGSKFSTQEDFIYLINLRSLGAMTKMELINRNLNDKPTGMQIIGRLIKNAWVSQKDSTTDKRSKLIGITEEGLQALNLQMGKIRKASDLVSGELNKAEKFELIRLLTKLKDFHQPIYAQNLPAHELLAKLNPSLHKN